MRVYRFEDHQGKGAVSYGGCDGPTPCYDGFPDDWQGRMRAAGSPAGGWFGIAHLEQGVRWFRLDQRRRFAERGEVVVSVYEVADDCVLIGGCQVIFAREKAEKVDELCPYTFGPSGSHHRHVRGERETPPDRYRYAGEATGRWFSRPPERTTAEEVRLRYQERSRDMMRFYSEAMPSLAELSKRLIEPLQMSNVMFTDWGPIEARVLAIDECPALPPKLDEEPADKPGYVRVNNGSTTCRAELAGLYKRK